jgi:endonuclease/exonuclease/phosphatase (EEP) superfamily protein YafD
MNPSPVRDMPTRDVSTKTRASSGLLHRLYQGITFILTGLTLFYTLAMLLLAVLWWLLPTRLGIIELTNIFAFIFFLPLPLLVLLALLLRPWLLRLSVVALLVLFLVEMGAAMLPHLPHPAPDTPPALRVITFNELFETSDAASKLDVLLAEDADVIALQELTDPLALALAQHTNEYPYQVLHPRAGPPGMGVVSRYPIEHAELAGPEAGFDMQRVVLNVDGTQVTMLNIHPVPPRMHAPSTRSRLTSLLLADYDTSIRDAQIAYILKSIRSTTGPLIVAGDLNTSDREPMYAPFDALLHDAYGEAGWGPGFTYSNTLYVRGKTISTPVVRIDYIFSSSDLVPLEAWVNCEAKASDHCMVVADLGFQHN